MYKKYGKRTLDVIIAAMALVVLAVPMLVVAVLIKLNSKGPAIFKQKRFGMHQKTIWTYKFRTMTIADQDGVATNSFKASAAYITPLGGVLRKLSIDELPQLFNVLKGDMSIVGPRPVILSETRLIEMREQVGANDVKPGITGWAQVNGRDELGDAIKSRLDGEYVRNLSFTTDVKCLVLTVLAVLAVKGHKEGHELVNENNGDGETIIDSHLAIDEG